MPLVFSRPPRDEEGCADPLGERNEPEEGLSRELLKKDERRNASKRKPTVRETLEAGRRRVGEILIRIIAANRLVSVELR